MLTVLMATHNGARTLPAVLEAYCRLEAPPGRWKLVIVDNASTDRTREIIAGFKDRLPIESLSEPQLGKNVALNAGLAHTAGNLIVLTDDDAIPQPDWLNQLRAVADTRPDYAVFGGLVLPQWEVAPPQWILEVVPLGAAYTITDPDREEGPIPPGEIFGPNMAVRAEVFAAGHTFDVSIGPRGANYPMGSETEFAKRLARSGYRCWYCKKAIVRHIVRAHQLDEQWLLRRARHYGRGRYRLEFQENSVQPKLLWGFPRYLLREAMVQMIHLLRARLRLRRSRSQIFKERWELACLVGRAIEGRKLAREGR